MTSPEDPLQGLEERLANHAKAFDSLLALTPAREYYGSQVDDGLDPNEQWNRKKQTKAQKRAAKMAKLDPANQKTALDVMKERELKRKREAGAADEEGERDGADDPQTSIAAPEKRQKTELDEDASEAKRRAKAEKRKEKRQKKHTKSAEKKAKAEAKKAAKQDKPTNENSSKPAGALEGAADADEDDDEDDAESEADVSAEDVEQLDLSGLTGNDDHVPADDDADEASSAPSSPAIDSPAFDIATNHSEASSSSSIPASVSLDSPKEPSHPKPQRTPQSLPHFPSKTSAPSGILSPKIQLPDIDQAELQERLRKRIEELRARRKADGPEGKPAKSRQELLDQRRKKEEQRKAHKKELRRQAKDEESKRREQQLRGSGSPLSSDIFSSSTAIAPPENNFSFSRLAFNDGTAADASLTTLTAPGKRKGPQDPRTALEAAERKQSRLAGLDAAKRADIAEKDMWLNAKKRSHGERVRDDSSLLKKALKRKEKQKSKSEKEWQDREAAVVKGKEMKQKKREMNLAKRREEKGGGGKKKSSKPSSGPGKKKSSRPGFEGRFKA